MFHDSEYEYDLINGQKPKGEDKKNKKKEKKLNPRKI